MKNLILFLFSVFLFSYSGFSNHSAGTSITYKGLGNNQYLVTTNLFLNCGPGVASFMVTSYLVYSKCKSSSTIKIDTLNFTPFVANNSSFGGPYKATYTSTIGSVVLDVEEVSDLCDAILNPNIPGNNSCFNRTGGGMVRYKYTGIVTLSPCDSWTLASKFVGSPTSSSVNLSSGYGNYYVETTINTLLFSNISAPDFNDDRSPLLVNACLNQTGEYHFGSNNIDRDSLVYGLTCVLLDSSTCSAYRPGYSSVVPMNNAKLDAVTGRFTFKPSTLGTKAVAVLISKYDKCTGKLKGTNYRRVEFDVIACTNKNPNYSYGIEKVTGPSAVKLDSFQVSTKAGDLFTIEDTLYDPDVNDTLVVFSDHDKYFPGSQLTLNYISNNRVHFKFSHQIPINEFGTKVLHFILSDEVCPQPGKKRLGYHIKVEEKLLLSGVNLANTDTLIVFKGDSVKINSSGSGKMNWSSLFGSPVIWNGINQNVWGDTMGTDTNVSILFQPDSSTWLSVSGGISSDCSSKVQTDSIYLKVIPIFSINVTADTVLCAVDSLQLNVIPDSNYTYTYKWETVKGSLSNDTVANPWTLSTENSIYLVTVTSQHGGERFGEVSVRAIETLPKMEVIADYDTVCTGSQVEMQLRIIDSTSNCSAGVPTKTSSYLAVHNNLNVLSDTVVPGLNNNPFLSSQTSLKHQYIYRADSLIKQGIKKGYIQGLSFYIDTAWGVGWTDANSIVSVSLACTNDTVLNSFISGGLTNVLSNKKWGIHPGWNYLSFTNSYLWDGSSNLLFQFCNTNGKYSRPVRTAMQVVNYNSTSVAFGATVSCQTQTISWGKRNLLPVTKFDWHAYKDTSNYSYSWKANNITLSSNTSIKAQPSVSTQYSLVVSDSHDVCKVELLQNVAVINAILNAGADTTKCDGRNFTMNPIVSPKMGGTYTWYPSTAFVNNKVNNAQMKVNGTTNAVVEFSYGPNCVYKDTVVVVSNSIPDPTITSTGPFCEATNNNPLTARVSGGVFSGDGVLGANFDATDSKVKPSLNSPKSVNINYELTKNGCKHDTTIVVQVFPQFDTTYSGKRVFCENDPVEVLKTGHSGGSWVGPGVSHSLFDPVTAMAGQHIVSVDSIGFCGNSATYQFTVNQIPKKELSSRSVGCGPYSTHLDAGNLGATYNWSTGDTSKVIQVNAIGSYWVEVTNSKACSSMDSIRVELIKQCVGIDTKKNDHLVELYPNPASKVLNVRVVGEYNSEAMVLLTDLTGKLIYNSKLDGNTTENITQIDVSNYISGVYMLSVSMGTVYSTYKVVIE